MRQIIFAPVNSWADSGSYLKNAVSSGTLVIIPENTGYSSLREFCTEAEVITLDALVEVFCEKSGGRSLLTETSVQSIITLILKEERYFNITSFRPGYAKAIARFLMDYRKQSIVPLEEYFLKDDSPLIPKQQDILKLHMRYEKFLEENGLFDKRRAVLAGREIISFRTDKLVFWGFSTLSPLDKYFIKTSLLSVPESLFIYALPPGSDSTYIRTDNSIRNLIAELKDSVPADKIEVLCNPPGKKRGSSALKDMHFVAASGRREEVETAARWICGRKSGEFQIYLPHYELYASYISEIFPRYGLIPRWEGGVPYKLFSLSAFLKSLVQQALLSNPYIVRKEIFCSSYFTFETTITKDRILFFINEKLKNKNKSFRQALIDSIKKSTHVLDYRRILSREESAYRLGNIGEEGNRYQNVFDSLQRIDDQKRKIREGMLLVKDYITLGRAEKSLYAFSPKMTPVHFIEALESLLELFHVKENLEKAGPPWSLRDQELFRSFPRLYDRFIHGWNSLGNPSNIKVSLDQLVRGFAESLKCETFQPALPDDGIAINTVDQLPFRKKDYTMILGLVEGEFPRREDKNFLTLNAGGKNIFHSYFTMDRDKELFYQLIRTPSKELFCSVPTSHGGKGLQKSSFIELIQKSGLKNSNDKKRNSHISLKEKLIEIGLLIDNRKEKARAILESLKQEQKPFYNQVVSLLRCQGMRSLMDRFGPFDGLLKNRAALKIVNETIHSSIRFTPREFALYAGCPMRFFLDHILMVKPEWYKDYHPDTTDRGRFILEILDFYTSEIVKKNSDPREIREKFIGRIEKEFKEYLTGDKNIFDFHMVRQFLSGLKDKKSKPGVFSAFLAFDAGNPDLLVPSGKGVQKEIMIDDIPVFIRIPRRDKAERQNGYVLYNYTTGEIEAASKIQKGLSFLLPLQIYASGAPRTKILGAGYFRITSPSRIKKGGYLADKGIRSSRQHSVSEEKPLFSGQKGFGFLDRGDLDRLVSGMPAVLSKMTAAMGRGIFHLPLCEEGDQICLNCAFKRICRKEQPRLDAIAKSDIKKQGMYVPKGLKDE